MAQGNVADPKLSLQNAPVLHVVWAVTDDPFQQLQVAVSMKSVVRSHASTPNGKQSTLHLHVVLAAARSVPAEGLIESARLLQENLSELVLEGDAVCSPCEYVPIAGSKIPQSGSSSQVCWGSEPPAALFVYYAVNPFENLHGANELRPDLASPGNYARFYFTWILPESVSRYIYMDGDAVANGSLQGLFDTQLPPGKIIGLVDECDGRFKAHVIDAGTYNLSHPAVTAAFGDLRSPATQIPSCFPNAGVMLVDVKGWNSFQTSEKAFELIQLHTKEFIYRLGSHPPIVLILFHKYVFVSEKWNQRKKTKPSSTWNENEGITHFNGKTKPWLYDDHALDLALSSEGENSTKILMKRMNAWRVHYKSVVLSSSSEANYKFLCAGASRIKLCKECVTALEPKCKQQAK